MKTRHAGVWLAADLGVNLDDVLASLHHHGFVGEHVFEMVEQLFGLAGSKVRIRLVVVPDDGTLLVLDVGAICCLRVQLHHRPRGLLPVEIGGQS